MMQTVASGLSGADRCGCGDVVAEGGELGAVAAEGGGSCGDDGDDTDDCAAASHHDPSGDESAHGACVTNLRKQLLTIVRDV